MQSELIPCVKLLCEVEADVDQFSQGRRAATSALDGSRFLRPQKRIDREAAVCRQARALGLPTWPSQILVERIDRRRMKHRLNPVSMTTLQGRPAQRARVEVMHLPERISTKHAAIDSKDPAQNIGPHRDRNRRRSLTSPPKSSGQVRDTELAARVAASQDAQPSLLNQHASGVQGEPSHHRTGGHLQAQDLLGASFALHRENFDIRPSLASPLGDHWPCRIGDRHQFQSRTRHLRVPRVISECRL
jgi:hypothetical protein